jgi:hypothetical protein
VLSSAAALLDGLFEQPVRNTDDCVLSMEGKEQLVNCRNKRRFS